jgi:glycosyltransferase involved in cell wall biosynthesis
MPGLRKVVIVNTTDVGGGAEEISMALLDGFEELGTETWLAVGSKRTEHPKVVSFYTSPHVDYTPDGRLARAKLSVRRFLDPRIGLEDFNHPYTRHVADFAGPRPDLLFCNNLHGGYFDLRELPRLSSELPVVLRLADSWSFTGHCAVPGTCERWRTGCGRCPDLAIPPAIRRDATRLNWRRKRRIYRRSRVFVIAPSRWMLERARESILAPAIAGARVVANGIDLAVFNPDGGIAERPGSGTPRLLFVANGGAANPYKGFGTVRAALGRLRGPLELVAVGGKRGGEEPAEGVRIRHEPRQPGEQLAALYRSADVYVHAAPEESFSLTTTEALACGTPVVAASGGGIAEVVDHGCTGLVVPPTDPAALAGALERLLADRELRDRMGAAAGAEARARFDRRRMVRQLHDFCGEAMTANGAGAAS